MLYSIWGSHSLINIGMLLYTVMINAKELETIVWIVNG
jgi:hypothetical protein